MKNRDLLGGIEITNNSAVSSLRKKAVIVGGLYIIGTVAGVLSVVLTGPLLKDPVDLIKISANANSIILGSLSVLAMGISLAMVPILMYPILKKESETLAVGYLVFRGALETFTYLTTVISFLHLLTLSQAYAQAGATATLSYQAYGIVLADTKMIGSITTIVFIIGALMFYSILYRSKLIPRWLSGWGLVSTIPYIVSGMLVLFDIIGNDSIIQTLLYLPLAIQEMVLGVWLIVKGFNSSIVSLKSK